MTIRTPPANNNYRKGWDQIYGVSKPEQPTSQVESPEIKLGTLTLDVDMSKRPESFPASSPAIILKSNAMVEEVKQELSKDLAYVLEHVLNQAVDSVVWVRADIFIKDQHGCIMMVTSLPKG